jgi:hypothetical protein
LHYANGTPDPIFLDNLENWFHFGKPSAAPTGFGFADIEAKHNITRADVNLNYNRGEGMQEASFTAGITASGNFDFGFVQMFLETTASMAARDGFAVRQQHLQPLDTGTASSVRVYTDLNAQTRTDLQIHANLKFPTLPIPEIDATFNIPTGNTGNIETPTVPSAMEYYDRPVNDGTSGWRGFRSYVVRGVPKPNPDQARIRCFLPSAPTRRTVEEPEDPARRVIDLASGAVDAVHPCNVKTCDSATSGEKDMRWDSASHSLVADGSKSFCSICANMQMNLCRTEAAIDPVTQRRKEVVISANPTAQNPEGSVIFIKNGVVSPGPGHSCVTQ